MATEIRKFIKQITFMWFDDFSKQPSETIQSCGMKAIDLRETD